jgi:hypothetical protein
MISFIYQLRVVVSLGTMVEKVIKVLIRGLIECCASELG